MSPGKGEASQNQPILVAEPSRGPPPGHSMIPEGTNDQQQASTTIKQIPPILTEDTAPLRELLQGSLCHGEKAKTHLHWMVDNVLGWVKEHPLIVEKGTLLSDYLDRVHLIPHGIKKTTLLTIIVDSESHVFEERNLEDEMNDVFEGLDRKRNAAFRHRLAQHKVYRGSKLSMEQVEFIKQKAIDIRNSGLPGYVSFSRDGMVIDASTPHHIVMTREEFHCHDNLEALRPYFISNPDHTLVIDADEEVFNMTWRIFPFFVQRVAFTDTRQIVGAIGDNFLSRCSYLTHIDISGLTALRKIALSFLRDCTSLTHFNSSGLMAVKAIGYNFLKDCENLTHFNFSDFKALEAIGKHFLTRYYLRTLFPRRVKPQHGWCDD